MPSDNKPITKIAIASILLLVVLFLAISCKECVNEPKPEPEYNIYLSVEDVLCTWVTLNVTLPDSGEISFFELKRNGCPVDTYSCVNEDTIIIEEGLIPDSDYYYKVRFLKDGEIKAESDSVDVHTMATTSHAFVWEVDTIGDYGSVLNDVFAFSENEVWAVGEIKNEDEPDELFGAAIWNGTKWDLIMLEIGYSEIRPRGIWASSNTDIWFACGSIYHWDGNETTLEWIRDINTDESTEKVWGSSSENIYFVGKEGLIVHSNGTSFTRMESGTDVDLNTIDGIYDSATGETRIWVTGIGILLYYDGSEWMELFSMDNPIFEDNFNNPNVVYVSDENYNIVSVWGGDNSGLYAFHQKNLLQNILLDNHDMFVKGIGGNSINDLFIVGSYNKIYHFNGEVIKPFHKLEGDGVLLGISQINDHVFAVGETSGFQTKAVVFRGKR